MKFSKPAVIAVSVAALIGGGVAADAATTTNPVKLCSNKVIQTVSVPKNGNCPSNANTFFVASQADVAALAGRMDSAASAAAAQAAKITALEAANQALAAKNAEQDDALTTLNDRVGALETATPILHVSTTHVYAYDYKLTLSGRNLKPGTVVYFSFLDEATQQRYVNSVSTVGPDGQISYEGPLNCDDRDFYATGIGLLDQEVKSNVVDMGCNAS